MALQDLFLSPIGLAAALVAIPIVLLYLIRPDPTRFELPTYRFLHAEEREQSTTPLLERLSRSLLLLLQLLAILLLAVSLAAPYVPVSERAVVEETVLVVDTSASMGTTVDGASRFDRALATAHEEVTSTTSIVTTAGGGSVLSRRAPPSETGEWLDGLTVTDAPGDLRGAISQAAAIAGENARIVVLSDFAGDDWTNAIATARARDLRVDLRQFDRGGRGNVGFVDRRFSGASVTLSVENFGETAVTRTIRLGSQQRELDLEAGDVATVTMAVPAGGGRAELTPGDDFPTDDTVFIAAPADPTVDVLVLTNDRNRFLTTALDVADQIDLTVAQPPTTVDDGYDVIVYSNVETASLLPGNVEAGRDVLKRGGGVAIQAQQPLPERYGDLLLVDPTGVNPSPAVHRTDETPLTRGIDFQPPEEAVAGRLREGQMLVELTDGSPLLATASRGGGRLMYYGYIEDKSSFKYNYQYPVFWKRAMFYLADRPSLSTLNHETGDSLSIGTATLDGPAGPVDGPRPTLGLAGFYSLDDRRYSASLLDEGESAVDVEPLTERSGPVGTTTREETRTAPRPITDFVAVAALGVVLLELGYLRRRGDL